MKDPVNVVVIAEGTPKNAMDVPMWEGALGYFGPEDRPKGSTSLPYYDPRRSCGDCVHGSAAGSGIVCAEMLRFHIPPAEAVRNPGAVCLAHLWVTSR